MIILQTTFSKRTYNKSVFSYTKKCILEELADAILPITRASDYNVANNADTTHVP